MHNSFSNLSVDDNMDVPNSSETKKVKKAKNKSPPPLPLPTPPETEPEPVPELVTITVNNSNNPKIRVRVVGSNIKINPDGVEVMSNTELLQVQYYCYGWNDLNSPLVGPFLHGKTYNIPKIPPLNYAQTALDVVLKAPDIPMDVVYKFSNNGLVEWETYNNVYNRILWTYYRDSHINVREKILQWVKASGVEPDDFKAAFNDLCNVPEMKRDVLTAVIGTDGDWNRYNVNKDSIVAYYSKTTPAIQKKLLPWINNWLGKK